MKVLAALKQYREFRHYRNLARKNMAKRNWLDKIAPKTLDWMRRCGALVLIILSLSSCQDPVPAMASEVYTIDQIANAIYKAEGGAKTSHPYGILTHYRKTTPRQACINTIRHALRDWDGKGDFIAFLGNRYAPIGVANDPKGLNRNWIKNVHYFLARLK